MAANNLLGLLEPFDARTDDGNSYVERLEQYFIVNDIVDAKKKVAICLTVIGSNTYTLLRNLLSPEKPASKTFENLVATLKKHLSPTPITIAERYKFYERRQREGEKLSDYIAEIRKLTEHCDFGDFLSDALRDKFVCGLHRQSIRKRLLAERKLTLRGAIEIAQSLEEAETQSSLISSFSKHDMKSEDFTNRLFQRQQLPRNSPLRRCYRCNAADHLANTCRFKQSICNNCNIKGHLAKACRKLQGRKFTSNTHQINTELDIARTAEESAEDELEINYTAEDESEIYHLHHIAGKNAYTITLRVNNCDVNFEIDTGSGLTIISEELYNSVFKDTPLQNTNICLKTYSGEALSVLGKLPAEIQHNGEVYRQVFIYVVKGRGTPLLGRDLLTHIKLNWCCVNKVENSLNKLLEQYSELFSSKLGKMKNFQAKLNVKQGATPKFCKARNIPFALQDAVKLELARLENEGILKPISYSDWASPIVIVTQT